MNKILIIGQAPPAVKQEVPYDTTLLYDMLSWVGISKEKAQDIFIFDAVYDKFPGYDNKGHKKPTQEQMDDYWSRELETKVQGANKILLLGKTAHDYFYSKPKRYSSSMIIISIPHPSKRNYSLINSQKQYIIKQLELLIK